MKKKTERAEIGTAWSSRICGNCLHTLRVATRLATGRITDTRVSTITLGDISTLYMPLGVFWLDCNGQEDDGPIYSDTYDRTRK